MYTLDQLETLMLVAESDDPMETALQIRRRWNCKLQMAREMVQDKTLPQICRDCTEYARKAQLILSALDEWIEEHQQREAS